MFHILGMRCGAEGQWRSSRSHKDDHRAQAHPDCRAIEQTPLCRGVWPGKGPLCPSLQLRAATQVAGRGQSGLLAAVPTFPPRQEQPGPRQQDGGSKETPFLPRTSQPCSLGGVPNRNSKPPPPLAEGTYFPRWVSSVTGNTPCSPTPHPPCRQAGGSLRTWDSLNIGPWNPTLGNTFLRGLGLARSPGQRTSLRLVGTRGQWPGQQNPVPTCFPAARFTGQASPLHAPVLSPFQHLYPLLPIPVSPDPRAAPSHSCQFCLPFCGPRCHQLHGEHPSTILVLSTSPAYNPQQPPEQKPTPVSCSQ